MTLILVVPALLWPRRIMRDALHDANFPALQTLLGKGRQQPTACTNADDWWCSLFGIRAEDFAPAALRLQALGGDAGDSNWLCADPVNLHVQPGGATLTDPSTLNVDAGEAAQLCTTLAPLLTDVGELVATTPSQWHLRLRTTPPLFPKRLRDLIGESAAGLLPSNPDDRQWRQLINDIQIALHDHPVNVVRRERGQAPINSIALWGVGRMPVPTNTTNLTVHCDDPVIAGLVTQRGATALPVAERFASAVIPAKAGIQRLRGEKKLDSRLRGNEENLRYKKVIVHWDKLLNARADHDAMRWREGLQQLETHWLAPALAALSDGSLKCIELHGFGDEAPLALRMTSMDRHCFWRKPRRLELL